MPSNFDRLQRLVFDAAKDRFATPAAYTPTEGQSWTGTVLFNSPSEAYRLAGIAHNPDEYVMEYREGDIPGLLEAVHARLTDERVDVDGTMYHVREVYAVHDGKTFRAYLIPVSPEL